jgi:hypothetical protein
MKTLQRRSPSLILVLLVLMVTAFCASPARAQNSPMKLVGTLTPWPDGQFGAVVADAGRGVAYMGSLDPTHGVSVIDMRDRTRPVLSVDLGPPPNPPNNLSTSYDVDLVGRYLLVAHHQDLGRDAFVGVSVYDISTDPFHPTLLRRISIPAGCGLESAELDPEAESGRPYAYCNAHCFINGGVYIANILTGEVLGEYAPPEPNICPGAGCDDNLPHESMIRRHPVSQRVLDYIGHWDSGLRIVDVTDPRNPVEVGSFDYGTGTPYRQAHGAVVTPSGNWVYVGDELGVEESGGIHIFDTHACDGTSYCTPVQVGFWHVAGHPVQDPNASAFPDYFRFDVHNMNPRGENTLLLGNYGLGIRLVDTSVKSDPEQISFYMVNASGEGDAQHPSSLVGRRTWIALFGSDGLIYASDINLGFFIVELNKNTVLPSGAARLEPAADASGTVHVGVEARTTGRDDDLRFGNSRSGSHSATFTTKRGGPVSLAIFDAAGRPVALVTRAYAPAGRTTLTWNGLATDGRRAPTGLYFARVSTPDGERTGKVVHLAP